MENPARRRIRIRVRTRDRTLKRAAIKAAKDAAAAQEAGRPEPVVAGGENNNDDEEHPVVPGSNEAPSPAAAPTGGESGESVSTGTGNVILAASPNEVEAGAPVAPGGSTSSPAAAAATPVETTPATPRFTAVNYPGRVHVEAQASLLSQEQVLLQTYRGFVNLAIIVGVILVARLAIILDAPLLNGCLALAVHAAFAVGVELVAMRTLTVREGVFLLLHGMNILCCMVLAIAMVWTEKVSSVLGFGHMVASTILGLKLVSYGHVNHALRAEEGGVGEETRYPGNIGFLDMLYFWLSPTLCYQPAYPKTAKRCMRTIVYYAAMLVAVGAVISLIGAKWVLPIVRQFWISGPSIPAFVDVLLTLSIPCTLIWLLGFVSIFHIALNLLAEVLRFGDRAFYQDWWNASTVSAFWRMWNLPVHHWMHRHLYIPCVRAGRSPSFALGACFFLSAVLHELLISVPLHMVRPYAFFGMALNIPLISFTRVLRDKLGREQQVGNFVFWITFCVVGQPASLLFYYHDFCHRSG